MLQMRVVEANPEAPSQYTAMLVLSTPIQISFRVLCKDVHPDMQGEDG